MVTEEKQVLRHIIKDIYGIDPEEYKIIDSIIDNYTDKVCLGQFKNNEKYIVGDYEGQIVSIEKKSLEELYGIIDQLFM